MATLVGIDIGSAYTKVVELEPKQNLKVINAVLLKTPYLLSQTASPTLSPRPLDTKALWQEVSKNIPVARLKTSLIAIAPPATAITTIYLLLPRMARGELATAAVAEAKRKMIPASGGNHTFEWLFLSERITAKIPRAEILVIRTEKNHIQYLLDIFKDIENLPGIITPICCTLPNIIPKEAWGKNEDIALVDLGAGGLNISIYSQGKLVFTRNVVYDFQNFTLYFSGQLGFNEAETENMLIEYGVPQVGYDPKNKVAIAEEVMHQKYEMRQAASPGEKPRANPLELKMLWQSYIEKVVHELRRSLTYYKEQSEGRRVEQIYFLGGISQIKNLWAILSTSIGGQCRVIDKIAPGPIFTGAASLALSILGKDKKQPAVNFLPLELKKKGSVTAILLVLRAAGICLIIVLGLWLVNILLRNHSLTTSIGQAEFRLNSLKKTTERLSSLEQQENLFQRQSSQIEELINKRADFYSPLKALSGIIPREILILQISIAKGSTTSSRGSGSMAAATGNADGNAINFPASGKTTTEEKYRITMQAEVFADYEEANKILGGFGRSPELTRYFRNIEITPLKLETISFDAASATGARDVPLTQPMARGFTLTAEVAKQ